MCTTKSYCLLLVLCSYLPVNVRYGAVEQVAPTPPPRYSIIGKLCNYQGRYSMMSIHRSRLVPSVRTKRSPKISTSCSNLSVGDIPRRGVCHWSVNDVRNLALVLTLMTFIQNMPVSTPDKNTRTP
jgi:hypothetical protein